MLPKITAYCKKNAQFCYWVQLCRSRTILPIHAPLSDSKFTYPTLFVAGNATFKSPCWSVGRSVGQSLGPSHFAFLGILRAGKFVFEHAPAQINTAPAQIITAPTQIITAPAQIIIAPAQLIMAPAQLPATKVVVYTALFHFFLPISATTSDTR